MQVFIKQTQTFETLELIDPKSGVNYVADFIANAGGFENGDFVFDDNKDAYITDSENFKWWQKVIKENQELDYRIHELCQEHGTEAVYQAISDVSVDLADHAAAVNAALDEQFGN